MEVDAISAQGGVVRLNAAAEQARKLADERQTAILQDQGVAVAAPTHPVVSNPTFSPALYAQAAQYTLYTQSGTLASLATQHAHTAGARAESAIDKPNEIHAVDEAHGGSVDALI